jgi:hypothetical protein
MMARGTANLLAALDIATRQVAARICRGLAVRLVMDK